MNILILDDSPCVCMMIENAVKEVNPEGQYHLVHTYDSALAILGQKQIDIAFLDIELEDPDSMKNGLTFASEMVGKYPEVKIVFVSGYPAFAINTFNFRPFDFIVKPVNIERLKQSASKIFETIEREKRFMFDKQESQKNNRLFIRNNKEMFFLQYDEILFIEKVNKEVLIHTERGNQVVRWTLAEFEELLPKSFVRTHKSFIVNADKISRISEFGDRTYEIFFGSINRTAMLSRYKANDLFDVMNVSYKESN